MKDLKNLITFGEVESRGMHLITLIQSVWSIAKHSFFSKVRNVEASSEEANLST